MNNLVNESYERAILGGILNNKELIADYESILCESLFTTENHKLIFNTVKRLYKENRPTDVLSVIEELKHKNLLEKAGNISYITNLSIYLPGESLFDPFLKELQELELRRNMITASYKLAEDIRSGSDINSSLEQFNSLKIENISSDEYSECNLDYIMQELYEELDNPTAEIKYKTGIAVIDKNSNGLGKGELVTIGAASGVGKSALSLKIAMNIYEESIKKDEKIKILIISREMASKEFAKRIVSSKTGIDKIKFDNKSFSTDDWQKMINSISLYSSKNIRIDTKSKTILDIKRHVKHFKPDILIVDYIQLITPTDSKESRERQVANISRELKNFTLDYNMLVIQLSQLADKGNNYRPHGETYMRESRAIYQDSNLVVYIHRPTESKELEQIYKNSKYKESRSFDEFMEVINTMEENGYILTEIILDKNRAGNTGKRVYWFEGKSLTYFAI